MMKVVVGGDLTGDGLEEGSIVNSPADVPGSPEAFTRLNVKEKN